MAQGALGHCRRRKACRLWTGGGPQRAYSGVGRGGAGRGHIVSPRAQLVRLYVTKRTSLQRNINKKVTYRQRRQKEVWDGGRTKPHVWGWEYPSRVQGGAPVGAWGRNLPEAEEF